MLYRNYSGTIFVKSLEKKSRKITCANLRICYYAFRERKTHKKFVKTRQVIFFLRGAISKTTDVRFKNNIWENRRKTLPSGNFSFSYFEVCHAGSSLFSYSEVSHSLELNRKKVLIIGNFPNLSLFSFDTSQVGINLVGVCSLTNISISRA